MSGLAPLPIFPKARIKVGYTTWYREKYKVRGDKFPLLRDGMLVFLVNEHNLPDRRNHHIGHYYTVLAVGQELTGVIPASYLELVQPTSI